MGIGLYAIVAGTLITGAANSLLTKYQDNQCVENCHDPNPANHKTFNQPGIQTMQMFLGELGMYLVFWYINGTTLENNIFNSIPMNNKSKINEYMRHLFSKVSN